MVGKRIEAEPLWLGLPPGASVARPASMVALLRTDAASRRAAGAGAATGMSWPSRSARHCSTVCGRCSSSTRNAASMPARNVSLKRPRPASTAGVIGSRFTRAGASGGMRPATA
jgi:hypothetical protein